MSEKIEKSEGGTLKGILAKPVWGWFGFVALMFVAAALFLWLIFTVTPWMKSRASFYKFTPDTNQVAMGSVPSDEELRVDIGRLQHKIDRLTPGGVYLIVNTTDNTFELYQNKNVITSYSIHYTKLYEHSSNTPCHCPVTGGRQVVFSVVA